MIAARFDDHGHGFYNLPGTDPVLAPEQDIADRQPIWDLMQMFWMDTDPGILFPRIVDVCAESKYSIEELEQIFWNEVRPAVKFNMWLLPAPEWAGFELEGLTKRILKKNRFGKRLPLISLGGYSSGWWLRLKHSVEAKRGNTAS